MSALQISRCFKNLSVFVLTKGFPFLNSVCFICLFVRGLFTKRMKDTGELEGQREPGWKLFGKVPLKDGLPKDPRRIQKVRSHTLI